MTVASLGYHGTEKGSRRRSASSETSTIAFAAVCSRCRSLLLASVYALVKLQASNRMQYHARFTSRSCTYPRCRQCKRSAKRVGGYHLKQEEESGKEGTGASTQVPFDLFSLTRRGIRDRRRGRVVSHMPRMVAERRRLGTMLHLHGARGK